jgi:hypothetical protein
MKRINRLNGKPAPAEKKQLLRKMFLKKKNDKKLDRKKNEK